jgi:hypothetical protein
MATLNIRIKGLVSLMNHAREQLSLGIPPSQADDFRAMVKDGVRTVEQICRQHHATPEDLPAPSRRAYAYLKGLDLKKLPLRTEAAPPVAKSIHIANVVATCNRYHAEFARLAASETPSTWDAAHDDVRRLSAQLRSNADAIAALCREEGGAPANLPAQSQHGYQWLTFLGDPENLAMHLITLAEAYQTAKTSAARKALPLAQRQLPQHITFYATSALYRTRIQEDGIHVVINEGFIDAPQAIVKMLIYTALHSKGKKQAAQIKAYAQSDAFEEILLALEIASAELSPNTQGLHHDLADVFDRVNAAYFGGAMPQPRLTWNKTITHRKFGHYQFPTDTVMISLSLDSAQVPPYTVDFVMYHELLHKHLGVKVVNGRRYAHTTAFREAEHAFKRYDDAQKVLAQLSKQHRQ